MSESLKVTDEEKLSRKSSDLVEYGPGVNFCYWSREDLEDFVKTQASFIIKDDSLPGTVE